MRSLNSTQLNELKLKHFFVVIRTVMQELLAIANNSRVKLQGIVISHPWLVKRRS